VAVSPKPGEYPIVFFNTPPTGSSITRQQ